jgi:hypothetical protein
MKKKGGDLMSCGTGECGCGCEELIELSFSKSLPVIEETVDCGDGSCGCGCADVSD